MKCTQCNSNIRTKGALFCPYCGAKLPQEEQGTIENCAVQQTSPKTNENNSQIDAENIEIERKCVSWLKEYDRLVIECNNIQGQLTRSFNRLSYIKSNDIVDCQRQLNFLPALAFTRKAELKQKISDLESEMAAEEKKQQQLKTEWNRLQSNIEEVHRKMIQCEFGCQWVERYNTIENITSHDIYDSDGGYTKKKIQFGRCYDNYTKSYKDIEWIVLEVEGDRILVISASPIDVMPYDESNNDTVTWETCTLRKWLNNQFFNEVFSDLEKSMIPTVTVPTEEYELKTNYMDAGNATKDKIFLLNNGEAFKYHSYLSCDGVRGSTFYGEYWWLRSPIHPFKGVGAWDYFALHYYFSYVKELFPQHSKNGVRPVMWINKHFES